MRRLRSGPHGASGRHAEVLPVDLTEYLACAHATTLSREVATGRATEGRRRQRLHEDDLREGQRARARVPRAARGRGPRRSSRSSSIAATSAAGAARTEELMRAGRRRDLPGAVRVGALARRRRLPRAHRRAVRARRLVVRGRRHQARAHRGGCRHHALQLVLLRDGHRARPGRGADVRRTSSSARAGASRSALREIDAVRPPRPDRHSSAAVERDRPTEPIPCEHCGFCASADVQRRAGSAEDHLTRVAWICAATRSTAARGRGRHDADAARGARRRDAWSPDLRAPRSRR